MDRAVFFRCESGGVELFAWLTTAQLYNEAPDQGSTLVTAFEEVNGGEMVPRDVLLRDLNLLAEV